MKYLYKNVIFVILKIDILFKILVEFIKLRNDKKNKF